MSRMSPEEQKDRVLKPLKDKKSNRELAEFTQKQLKAITKKPLRQTKLKLRKGFSNAPITYTVLMTTQLTEPDRKIVTKALVHCTTPNKCRELMAKEPGWMYRDISFVQDHKCGLLLYKGLSVALFYHRQVINIEPMPNDPVPSGVLENDEDVWVRLDLFSLSPRQQHQELREQDTLIIALRQQVAALEAMLKPAQKANAKEVIQKVTALNEINDLAGLRDALNKAFSQKSWLAVSIVRRGLIKFMKESKLVKV